MLVTILILIDGFLQFARIQSSGFTDDGHNPYFNRWFSAILIQQFIIICMLRHNPYFNRWFSAIKTTYNLLDNKECHNPYFNRWFSAMKKGVYYNAFVVMSQSLF